MGRNDVVKSCVQFVWSTGRMTARVLVVDDILANVKLLEDRLQAEYFEVITGEIHGLKT